MQFVWRGQHKERGRTKVFTFLEYHAWPSASYLLTQCKVGPFIYFLTEIMETFLPLNLIHTFRNYFERSLLRSFRCNFLFRFFLFFCFFNFFKPNSEYFFVSTRLNSKFVAFLLTSGYSSSYETASTRKQ